MEIYELQARYDSRKSFYGKAQVIEHDDGITSASGEFINNLFREKQDKRRRKQ